MIYSGAYQYNMIYGTSRNNKVIATTTDDATFIRLILNVDFQNEVWSHTFEIPFFKNKAEFIFENYVHSIITQKFNTPSIIFGSMQTHAFPIANVSFELKEMKNATELSSISRSFKMILGNYRDISLLELANNTYLLPVKQSNYTTNKNLLSYTILTKQTTVNIDINGFVTSMELQPSILQTITIPTSNINTTLTDILFEFNNNQRIILPKTQIIQSGNDHHLLVYQNLFGTISVIEFLGNMLINNRFRNKDYRYVNQNITKLSTSNIEQKEEFKLNTGYIFDFGKYEMLFVLLKSFNIYYKENSIQSNISLQANNSYKKVIMSRSHSLKPYQSRIHDYNETLTFKIAENADIHYRQF